MKKIPRFLQGVFGPRELQNLDAEELLQAITNQTVAKHWLYQIYSDLKQMNLEIDRCLASGREINLIDLCARRRAYQDVLEAIKSAKTNATQAANHNPQSQATIDLDRVTV